MRKLSETFVEGVVQSTQSAGSQNLEVLTSVLR